MHRLWVVVTRRPEAGRQPCILIAGGGTGGHVFPGIAVAEQLKHAGVRCLFVGTRRGIESRIVPARGFELELLDVAPMTGGGTMRFLRGALTASRALAASFSVIAKYNPCAMLSVGGYAAGPISLAGALRRVPLALLEPNGVLGFTNRVLAPFAARAYVSWAALVPQFRNGVAVHTGMPIRANFAQHFDREPAADALRAPLHILVLGGSQGAHTMNAQIPLILAGLAPAFEFSVTHQTGPNDLENVCHAYAQSGVKNAVARAFIEDTASEIARADVVIARAGASTVAEICAIGRAAILVPFPHAAADHQTKNANALVALGGAMTLSDAELSSGLATVLTSVLRDPVLRAQLARVARSAGRAEAAQTVANDLMRLGGLARGAVAL